MNNVNLFRTSQPTCMYSLPASLRNHEGRLKSSLSNNKLNKSKHADDSPSLGPLILPHPNQPTNPIHPNLPHMRMFQKSSNKFSKPCIESIRASKPQFPKLQMCQGKLAPLIPSPTKSSNLCQNKFRVPTQPEKHMFLTPKYSNILDKNTPNLYHYPDIIRYDSSLFLQKLSYFYPGKSFVLDYRTVSHAPFFFPRAILSNSPPSSIRSVLKGDSIHHFVTTHQGRRRFSRLPVVYHIHRDIVEFLLPTFTFPTDERASVSECPYKCQQLYQSCSWHLGMPYSPQIAVNRNQMLRLLIATKLIDDAYFWLSLAQIYQDSSFEEIDPYRDEKDTHLMLNLRLDVDLPPLKMIGDIRMPLEVNIGYWMRGEDEFDCDFSDPWKKLFDWDISVLKPKETQAIGGKPAWHCSLCESVFTAREWLTRHLKVVHNRLSPLVPLCAAPETPEEDDPIEFSRQYFSEKLSEIFQAVSDSASALPKWLKEHTRFMINFLSGCVGVMFSSHWAGVVASLAVIGNELVNEFGEVIRQKASDFVNCLKQVIQRFFPVAQAQPTPFEDHRVANESFITSLFGIISAVVPGMKVEAGIFKSRIQRIQSLASCLSATKTITDWMCTFFDKIWTWIQIYCFGATSEELSRTSSLLSSPEIQLWINDVNRFEIGTKDQAGNSLPSGLSKLLKDKESQDMVVDLKTRGDDILLKLSSSDMVKQAKVTSFVTRHLNKVDKWFNLIADTRGATDPKHEPFVIYLYGDPGVGKSFAVDYLTQALCHAAGREYRPTLDKFSKPRDSPFYDGYNNQFCYVMDDFMQIVNTDANTTDLSFLIDVGSRTTYHMNMAQLEKKASTYFTSPLVILTSNVMLNPESFNGMLSSYPALARRIDVAIEVRRDRDHVIDASRNFDPEGVYFSMSKFQFTNTEKTDGKFFPMGKECDWEVLVAALSALFIRKMRKQTELDQMDGLNDTMQEVISTYADRFRGSRESDEAIVDEIFTHDVQQIPGLTWKLKYKDVMTNQDKIKDVPVFQLAQQPPRASGSKASSLSSLEIQHMPDQENHPARRNSAPMDIAAACDQMLAAVKETRQIIKQENELAGLPVDPETESSDDEEVRVAQAGECPLSACPVPNCVKFMLQMDDATQMDMHSHMMVCALDATPDGDAHFQYAREAYDRAQILPRFSGAPLSPAEEAMYAEIQSIYVDYQPRGMYLQMSDALARNDLDSVRAMLLHYRRYDRTSMLGSLIAWPKRKLVATASYLKQQAVAVSDRVFSPIQPVVNAIKEASQLIESIKRNFAKIAILGSVFALGSAVLLICAMRWWKKSPSVAAEAFVSGDNKVAAKKKKQMRVETDAEAFVSGDNRTSARKKRVQRVECRYSSNFVFSSMLNDVALKRADVADEPDLVLYQDGKTVTLKWASGETCEVVSTPKLDRDYAISRAISAHYAKDVTDEAKGQSEAKSDRMGLVESLIGKYPTVEASRDETASNLMNNLINSLIMVHCNKSGLTLNGAYIDGTIVMFPRHVLGASKPEGAQLTVFHSSGVYRVVLGKQYPWVEVKDKDTVFVDLKETKVQAPRSLLNKFIRKNDELTESPGYLVLPTLDNAKTHVHMMRSKQLIKCKHIGKTEYLDPQAAEMVEIASGLDYIADTQSGDCGGLVLRFDPRKERKLMGFHVAGTSGSGTATLWTEEALSEVLKNFNRAQAAQDFGFCQIDTEEFFDCIDEQGEDWFDTTVTFCEPISNIDPKLAPGCPLTSSLQPSPIFNMITETKSGPSTLRPFVNEEGERLVPIKIALSKLESPMIQFDEGLVEKCAAKMLVCYSRDERLKWYGEQKNGKLTDDENLCGVDEDKWIKPVNMKTSPGYPYILAGGKRKFLDPENKKMHPILLRAMDAREQAAKRGEQFPALMVDVLKDERLSNEKRKKGKVRIFNVCPLDFNLLVRRYFTRFLAQMMQHHTSGEVSVGLNVHDDSWAALYKRLKGSGSHWIAGDYSAWDKRMPIQVAIALLPLVEQFYKQFEDYDPADAIVRKTLLMQAFQSVRLAQTHKAGLIYRVHQSMPSGIAVTAVYNSLINALLFRVIFAELAIEAGWRVAKAVNSYHEHVRFIAYGDDHIARVSSVAFGFFNMQSIARKMGEHHITYTAASKGEVEGPEVADEDLTYLKRRFVPQYGRLDAPMDIDNVLDILNWVNVSSPSEAKEACESAIKSVLIELSHHSKEVFDQWYAQILTVALQNHLDVPICSYDEVVDKRRNEAFTYYDDGFY